MSDSLRLSLVVLAGVALAAPAFAADPGWYTDLRTGATDVEKQNSLSSAANFSIDPNTGWMIEGAVGYRFASPLRLALQGGYQYNTIRGSVRENVAGLCGGSAPCLTGDVYGHIAAPSLFGLAYYDIQVFERLRLSLGGGVGAQRVDLGAFTMARSNNGTSSPFMLVDANDTVFADRGSAELAYNLGRADLTLGYTFTHSAKVLLPGRGAFVPFTFAENMVTHAFTAGVRFAF